MQACPTIAHQATVEEATCKCLALLSWHGFMCSGYACENMNINYHCMKCLAKLAEYACLLFTLVTVAVHATLPNKGCFAFDGSFNDLHDAFKWWLYMQK